MTIRAALIAGLLFVSGCTTTSGLDNGGEPGAKDPPEPAGKASMVGGLINGSIGEGLSAADKRKALEAEYRALEYTQGGQTVTWAGSRASRKGDVVPAQPYRVGSQDCRQYSHTVTVDGTARSARGTACRNEDGSWATLS